MLCLPFNRRFVTLADVVVAAYRSFDRWMSITTERAKQKLR